MIYARDDRWLEEIWTKVGSTISACQDFGATLDGVMQLPLDCFELAQTDHGADFDIRLGHRADAKLFRFFNAKMNEALGDGLFNVNALDGKACLAAIRETSPDSRAGRSFKVGVGQNNHCVFSAELEHGRN